MGLWQPSDEIEPYPPREPEGPRGFAPGHPVLLHLARPSEKFWGLLAEIGAAGITLRGISVESFDDWSREVARSLDEAAGDEEAAAEAILGLATMFFPLHRVERLFLDEPVGLVESYGQRFERRVGKTLGEYFAR